MADNRGRDSPSRSASFDYLFTSHESLHDDPQSALPNYTDVSGSFEEALRSESEEAAVRRRVEAGLSPSLQLGGRRSPLMPFPSGPGDQTRLMTSERGQAWRASPSNADTIHESVARRSAVGASGKEYYT
jgi:hypothetical protein